MVHIATAPWYSSTSTSSSLSDGHLVLGEVPGWDGVYIATGAGRQGIRFGPGMALAIVDLITKGSSHISLDAFNPGRFAE